MPWRTPSAWLSEVDDEGQANNDAQQTQAKGHAAQHVFQEIRGQCVLGHWRKQGAGQPWDLVGDDVAGYDRADPEAEKTEVGAERERPEQGPGGERSPPMGLPLFCPTKEPGFQG